MTDPDENISTLMVPVLTNSEAGYSVFVEQSYPLDDHDGLIISPRIDAQNFRHRVSLTGYYSDWHVAGDPTLILIRAGVLRIGLRDGSYRDFGAGDIFIARDSLPDNTEFDEQVHGHTAELIGDLPLKALHIKLENL